jgi:hypothetical protein
VAEIDALVFEVTAVVFTVKVADVLPAGIVTVDGVVAEATLLDNEMASPPVGAAEVMVTVPVLVLPPLTEVGLKVTDLIVGAVRVS